MKRLSTDILDQGRSLLKELAEFTGKLVEARRAEMKAQARMDQLVIQMNETRRRKVLELAQLPQYAGAVDPRTGKANKDWTELLIEDALSKDREMVKLLGDFYEAQQASAEAKVEVTVLVEQVGTMRVSAKLLAAISSLAAAEGGE